MSEDKAQQSEQETQQIVKHELSSNHIQVYVNAGEVGFSSYDIRVKLGQLVERDGQTIAEVNFTLMMSPQHAKVLTAAMAQSIRAYEAQHGEISLQAKTPLLQKAATEAEAKSKAKTD